MCKMFVLFPQPYPNFLVLTADPVNPLSPSYSCGFLPALMPVLKPPESEKRQHSTWFGDSGSGKDCVVNIAVRIHGAIPPCHSMEIWVLVLRPSITLPMRVSLLRMGCPRSGIVTVIRGIIVITLLSCKKCH